jgi:hypothetical protein
VKIFSIIRRDLRAATSLSSAPGLAPAVASRLCLPGKKRAAAPQTLHVLVKGHQMDEIGWLVPATSIVTIVPPPRRPGNIMESV